MKWTAKNWKLAGLVVAGVAVGALIWFVAEGGERDDDDEKPEGNNSAQAFPPVAPTATIKTIYLVSDEGVDAGPEFNGLYVLDNIDFNGYLISEPN